MIDFHYMSFPATFEDSADVDLGIKGSEVDLEITVDISKIVQFEPTGFSSGQWDTHTRLIFDGGARATINVPYAQFKLFFHRYLLQQHGDIIHPWQPDQNLDS